MYADPLTPGHVQILEMAKKLGDRLYVIVNNDNQASMKKGKAFMPEQDRLQIVKALSCVDAAIIAVDQDRTVCKTIRLMRPDIFANGGDVTEDSPAPERQVCDELGVQMVYGLGPKISSSRWYLEQAGFPKYT
jgi:cytidyltransferase-like protein